MQVNWRSHEARLRDPWTALDPYYNLRLGAWLLATLARESRDLAEAIGRYHAPGDPARAARYRERVVRWLRRLTASGAASAAGSARERMTVMTSRASRGAAGAACPGVELRLPEPRARGARARLDGVCAKRAAHGGLRLGRHRAHRPLSPRARQRAPRPGAGLAPARSRVARSAAAHPHARTLTGAGRLARGQSPSPRAAPVSRGRGRALARMARAEREHLAALGAVGLAVEVADLAGWRRLTEAAQGLVLLPVSGTALAQRLALGHYPVLVTRSRIEQ